MSAPTITLTEFLDNVGTRAVWTPPPVGYVPHSCACFVCVVEKAVLIQDLAVDFGLLPNMG